MFSIDLSARQSANTKGRYGPPRPRPAAAQLAAAAVFALLSLALPAVAHAHGDEAEIPARELVLQAIAYIVNTPDDSDMISEKLMEATESEDASGVDLEAVDRAMAELDDGDLVQGRILLEESIGARPDLSGMDVRHVLNVAPGASVVSLATGEQAGTAIVTDELSGRGPWTGTDSVLVAIAAVTAGLGLLLSWRFRPAHSIHTLQHQMVSPSGPPGGRAMG